MEQRSNVTPNSSKQMLPSVLDRLRDALERWGLLPQPILRPVPARVKHRRIVRRRRDLMP
jgi:hypothetical protein